MKYHTTKRSSNGRAEEDSGSDRAKYPPGDAQEIHSGRESADRAGRIEGREHDRRVVPEGRDPTQPVLQMEQGISGSRKAAPDRGHPASGRQPGSRRDAE